VQAQDSSPPARPAGAQPTRDDAQPAPDAATAAEPTHAPADGFQSRGRARRRARFLRKARELAYRDLGGLVFNLHRFGARNDALVLAKLTTLTQIDAELRAIEGVLGERRPITVLREAGITACPRCAAIHGSEDSFCPNCGLSLGRHVDLPIAGAAAATPAPPAVVATPAPPAVVTTPAPPPAPAPPAPAAAVIPAAPGPVDPAPAAAVIPTAPGPVDPARAPVPAAPVEEDGPTEILRPPASGS
jgi:hypothetical protein